MTTQNGYGCGHGKTQVALRDRLLVSLPFGGQCPRLPTDYVNMPRSRTVPMTLDPVRGMRGRAEGATIME
jgi:hypothetical protein